MPFLYSTADSLDTSEDDDSFDETQEQDSQEDEVPEDENTQQPDQPDETDTAVTQSDVATQDPNAEVDGERAESPSIIEPSQASMQNKPRRPLPKGVQGNRVNKSLPPPAFVTPARPKPKAAALGRRPSTETQDSLFAKTQAELIAALKTHPPPPPKPVRVLQGSATEGRIRSFFDGLMDPVLRLEDNYRDRALMKMFQIAIDMLAEQRMDKARESQNSTPTSGSNLGFGSPPQLQNIPPTRPAIATPLPINPGHQGQGEMMGMLGSPNYNPPPFGLDSQFGQF